MDLIRCKTCGQLFLYADANNKGINRYEVFESIKKTGKYLTNHDAWYYSAYGIRTSNSLVSDFGFLTWKQLGKKEWEYTIEDYEQYSDAINHLEKDNIVISEIQDYQKYQKCPICGSDDFYKYYGTWTTRTGEQKKKVSLSYSFLKGLSEEEKNSIQEENYKEDAETIEPEYIEIIQDCQNSIDASRRLDVNLGSINIERYLEGLLAIKTTEYALEQRLKELLHQKLTSSQNCTNAECKLILYGIEELEDSLAEVNRSIDEIVDRRSFRVPPDWYVGLQIEKPIEPIKPEHYTASKPTIPFYKKPGLFNKKAVLAENEVLKAKYDTELAEWTRQREEYEAAVSTYQKELAEYNDLYKQFKKKEEAYVDSKFKKWVAELAEANPRLKQLQAEKEQYEKNLADPDAYIASKLKNNPAFFTRDLTEAEINNCINSLKKAYQAEEDYLSPGIFFPKYATLPAVSTIYEYIVSGRCSELKGADGAYNLYESEIRADRVIEQLDSINEKLDQIKANQYILFRAIQSVGSQLSSLNRAADKMTSELRTMSGTLSDISESAAVTACFGIL